MVHSFTIIETGFYALPTATAKQEPIITITSHFTTPHLGIHYPRCRCRWHSNQISPLHSLSLPTFTHLSPNAQSARGLQHIRSLLYLELIIAFAERRCSWCFRFAFCSSVLSFLSLRLFGFLAAGAGRKGRRQAIGQGRDIWHRPSEILPFLCSRGT